jgi:hypothetical protein
LEAATQGAGDASAVRRGCVWCHAPTALVSGDFALAEPVTREGVTCDFCHTLADVDLGKSDHPFELAPGDVKRGPFEYAEGLPHETAYSTLHRSSALLCASCHEYRNAHGVAVLSTYTEWKAGPYPDRGETCQECHMPLVPGTAVAASLEPTSRQINLHRVVGGSLASRVRGGVDLSIESVAAGSGSADVRVVVTNTGVGHDVPGGLSSKSLVLTVGVETTAGTILHQKDRTYRRQLLDAEGRELTAVEDLFLATTAVGQDTRLKPGESRNERFSVPLPDDWKAIVARLEYRDASDPSEPPVTRLIAEQRHARSR